VRKELIQYRLQKARETLEDAELLISNNRLTSAINRLYYSLFYAVLALLQTKDLASSKHSGVRSLFNQHFVKTGVVSKETGAFYGELSEDRREGDYIDYTEFSLNEVKEKLKKCGVYLKEIEKVTLELMGHTDE